MATVEKPICKYGSKCYRKNPKHFTDYFHTDTATKNTDVKRRVEQKFSAGKKAKLDVQSQLFVKADASKGIAGKLKQTTLQFGNSEIGNSPRDAKKSNDVEINELLLSKDPDLNNAIKKKKCASFKTKKESLFTTEERKTPAFGTIPSRKSPLSKLKNSNENSRSDFNNSTHDSQDGQNYTASNSTQNSSWVYIKKPSYALKNDCNMEDLKIKSAEEMIKILFLVEMPKCFYSFYDFCKSVDNENAQNVLEFCGLKIVGPFDVLSGKLNLSVDKDLALCHWRFYFDPPEFQTVLASNSGYHIGYWRDDPKEQPVFLASNNCDKDCVFKVEAENIFSAVNCYLENFIKICDPFKKVDATKFKNTLVEWAEKHKFTLLQTTDLTKSRQKRVVTKTFHKLGIVVPVDKKTELGYRPLIESDANLKKICKLIMDADEDEEVLWDNLEPLINAANIANDECDFGNSLELGIDLFCMGSTKFHATVKHLLSNAYTLLGRTEFEKIIVAHLKHRKKGQDLSVT